MKFKTKNLIIIITLSVGLGGMIILGQKYSKNNSIIGDQVDSLNNI